VWQCQESNHWTSCHPAMGALIEAQQDSTFQIIVHEAKRYFIEKYNGSMGRQSNLRTADQRPIRRVQIKAWVQPRADSADMTASDEEKAIDYLIGMPMQNPNREMVTEEGSAEPERRGAGDQGRTQGFDRQDVGAQSKGQTQVAESREIVMNPNWELLTKDDDVWETMATYCEMDEEPEEIEAVWRWTGDSPIEDGLERHEDALLYIPDRLDAADLLRTGRFEEDGSGAQMMNITLCTTVEQAIELNTFENECDDNGNVTVFACNVVLDEEQRAQLEGEEYIEMTNPKHIELVMCGSINLEKLKAANSEQDFNDEPNPGPMTDARRMH